MFTIKDFKIELQNPEEVKEFVKKHGLMATVCYNTDPKYAEKVGESCLKSGHLSGSRHLYAWFTLRNVPRSCYDEETEILTLEGWKFIKDIKEDEIVATLNDTTKNVEFHKIKEKIVENYNGNMFFIKSENVDLAITENHNMYYKKYDVRKDKDKTYLTPIKDINVNRIKLTKEFEYKCINNLPNIYKIKGYTYKKKTNNGGDCNMYTGDLELDRKTFYKFLAWYLSDGSTYYNEKENKYVISISQTNCKKNIENHTKEDIQDIIIKLGFAPTVTDRDIRFNSLTLGKFLKQLGTASNKYIPLNIYDEFNKEYAQIFLNEYFRGDGHLDKNGCGKFYTCSEILANQLQQLCFLAGWSAMIYTRNENLVGEKIQICNKTVKCNYVGYVINVSFNTRNKYPHVSLKKHKTVKHYEGKVYCVNVPNHIIFVRRNGKAVWCGNCVDQLVRHYTGFVPQVQSLRYCSKDGKVSIYIAPELLDSQYMVKTIKDQEDIVNAQYNYIQTFLEDGGITGEKANEIARTILPIGISTSCNIAVNLECLMHLANVRLCTRAELPIRTIVKEMVKQVIEVEPRYKPYLVPNCVKNRRCPEGKHSCGKYNIFTNTVNE